MSENTVFVRNAAGSTNRAETIRGETNDSFMPVRFLMQIISNMLDTVRLAPSPADRISIEKLRQNAASIENNIAEPIM